MANLSVVHTLHTSRGLGVGLDIAPRSSDFGTFKPLEFSPAASVSTHQECTELVRIGEESPNMVRYGNVHQIVPIKK
jgi:hypothetical protein